MARQPRGPSTWYLARALAEHGQIFPGDILDAEASAKLGTDPGRSDADGDGP